MAATIYIDYIELILEWEYPHNLIRSDVSAKLRNIMRHSWLTDLPIANLAGFCQPGSGRCTSRRLAQHSLDLLCDVRFSGWGSISYDATGPKSSSGEGKE